MRAFIIDIILAIGLVAALLLGSFSEFTQQCEEVQHSVLRLHIPANSDSDDDQRLKLELRDMLLKQYGSRLSECDSLEEAYIKAEQLLPEIDAAADLFLAENGADYEATAELVNMYFPTRKYESITLPAGSYDAIRVTLGKGNGQNWWCVMYPSLCLSAVSDKLPEELMKEENEALYPFLSDEPVQIEVKFALFELIKKLFK